MHSLFHSKMFTLRFAKMYDLFQKRRDTFSDSTRGLYSIPETRKIYCPKVNQQTKN